MFRKLAVREFFTTGVAGPLLLLSAVVVVAMLLATWGIPMRSAEPESKALNSPLLTGLWASCDIVLCISFVGLSLVCWDSNRKHATMSEHGRWRLAAFGALFLVTGMAWAADCASLWWPVYRLEVALRLLCALIALFSVSVVAHWQD